MKISASAGSVDDVAIHLPTKSQAIHLVSNGGVFYYSGVSNLRAIRAASPLGMRKTGSAPTTGSEVGSVDVLTAPAGIGKQLILHLVTALLSSSVCCHQQIGGTGGKPPPSVRA